jgi:AAA+ superfamily predicted ATPase
MEAYKKVKDYLCEHVGNMVMPGTPRFNEEREIWEVAVLCKSEKGIFIVGEIWLNKELEFVRIPTKEEMLKILQMEEERMPFLVYATRDELEKKKRFFSKKCS